MLINLILIPLTAILVIIFYCKKTLEIFTTSLYFAILNQIQIFYIAFKFDYNTSEFQFQTMGKLLGIDGVSQQLQMLIIILTPIILLSSYKSINQLVKSYVLFIWGLILGCIAVFLVLDLLLFYICFESILIPMFFLIGIYGGRNRKVHAAYEFFLYTLIGSLFQFLAIVVIYIENGTTDYQVILTNQISNNRQIILWLGFFISLAIKIPMVPLHIWLPEAHVEAPTAASVLLAAILLKLGSYGFIRYSIPLFPYASKIFVPLVMTMSLIGIIYSSLTCLAQWDLKKFIAYSSVGHMNFTTIGLFSNNLHGIKSSIYFLISHGLISSALFLLVGVIYDRFHTRTIRYYGGLVYTMPIFVLFFIFFSLANIALPATSAYISEIYTLIGSFQFNPILTLFASLAIIIGPTYSLWFAHKLAYGSYSKYLSTVYQDLTLKEIHLFIPLIFLTFLFGIKPNLIFDFIFFTSSSLLY